METKCAWCGIMLEEDRIPKIESLVSHGICDDCLQEIFVGERANLQNFINSIPEPLLITTKNAEVVAVNRKAAEIIDKPVIEIDGLLFGRVVDCVHPDDDYDCGETEHCPECEIRALVEETYRTGNFRKAERVFVEVEKSNNTMQLYILLSAEKVDDYVVLQIDGMEQST